MLLSLALRISRYILGTDVDYDRMETCAYGIDVFLYTVISTAGLMLLGWACGRHKQTAILILVYYLNQSSGGGYHADSHTKCFITMILGLFISIGAFSVLNLDCWINCTIALFAVSCLWVLPVVIHPNKEYLHGKKRSISVRSRIVSALSFAFAVSISFYDYKLGEAAVMGMTMAMTSRVAAILIEKKK